MDKDKKEELKEKVDEIIDDLLSLIDRLDDIYEMIDAEED